HDRDLLHAHLRQDRLIAEDATSVVAIREQIRLQRQESAGAIAEMHDRQAILDRDVEGAHRLLHRKRIPRAALHARVAGVDQHFAARHDADAGDDRRARHFAVVLLIRRERRELEERRARIEQPLDALAHEQLVLLAQAIDVALRTIESRLALPLAQILCKLAVMRRVRRKLRRARVQARFDALHQILLTMPRLSRRSSTAATSCCSVSLSVSSTSSALVGSSYGSSMPVKFLIWPARAFL